MTCYGRSLHIVPAIVTCEASGDLRKEKKRDAKEMLGAAIKKLRKQAAAYGDADISMGLIQAADLLEAGDF